MNNNKTPKPGDPEYPVNQPQQLNTPKFNSSGKRSGDEIPPVENLNDQQSETAGVNTVDVSGPDVNLGNERNKNEKQRERIIRR